MIQFVDNSELMSEALNFCDDKLCGARIASFLEAYGYSYQFARFWIQKSSDDMITAALSCVDGVASLEASENADYEELSAFLPFSEMKTLFSDEKTSEKLGMNMISRSNSMVYNGKSKRSCFEYNVIKNVDLKAVYACLSSSFDDLPPFEEWLPDVSHRIRHKTASAFAKEQNGVYTSVAMAVGESEKAVILGGVATAPEYRNMGYAGELVSFFTEYFANANKKIYLCCEKDKLNFYNNLGFVRGENFTISTLK